MSCAASPVVAVVGPTASGKSDMALTLGQRYQGELVNADAFQWYRGMSVGTAKPGAAERAALPHHCLDLLDVTEPSSVAWFQSVGRTAVRDIQSRGRLPVVVGGSMLYVRALCDVFDIPPSDPEVRARIDAEAEEVGSHRMHERLREVDPDAAAVIDPRNRRRIVRALEVVELTGSFTARLPAPQAWRPTLWLAPARTRAELDERIEQRTVRMWQSGLVAETEALVAAGLAAAPTAAKAVGYPQAMAFLAGTLSRDEAVAETIRATRALARRQERVFRRDPRVHWVADSQQAAELVERFLAQPTVAEPTK